MTPWLSLWLPSSTASPLSQTETGEFCAPALGKPWREGQGLLLGSGTAAPKAVVLNGESCRKYWSLWGPQAVFHQCALPWTLPHHMSQPHVHRDTYAYVRPCGSCVDSDYSPTLWGQSTWMFPFSCFNGPSCMWDTLLLGLLEVGGCFTCFCIWGSTTVQAVLMARGWRPEC